MCVSMCVGFLHIYVYLYLFMCITTELVRAQGGATVKEGEAFVPEVLFGGKYYPICGHYFWDNDFGAGSVCKSLGFTDRSDIHATSKTGDVYDTDAMPVGGCKDGEDLTKCTGGDNAWGNFDFRGGRCKRGNSVGVKVTCYTQGVFVCMHMYILLYVCTLYTYGYVCIHVCTWWFRPVSARQDIYRTHIVSTRHN